MTFVRASTRYSFAAVPRLFPPPLCRPLRFPGQSPRCRTGRRWAMLATRGVGMPVCRRVDKETREGARGKRGREREGVGGRQREGDIWP